MAESIGLSGTFDVAINDVMVLRQVLMRLLAVGSMAELETLERDIRDMLQAHPEAYQEAAGRNRYG